MSRYHPDLLCEIEAFTSRHEMPDTTFGRRAMGDPHLVRDIRLTRCLRPESVEKIRDFMAVYHHENQSSSAGKTSDLTAAQQSEAA